MDQTQGEKDSAASGRKGLTIDLIIVAAFSILAGTLIVALVAVYAGWKRRSFH